MRTIAPTLVLLLASTATTAAFADEPVDGGAPPADAAPPPPDAAPPPPDAARAAPSTSGSPYSLLSATPPPAPDVPAHARPTPLYKSTLFWCSVILGAGAVAAISVGIGMAATFHPRYALVTF
jgi:hypothetical protein